MILVINLGLKSVRAIIFNQEGQKIESCSLPIMTMLRGEFIEQDPEEWWQKRFGFCPTWLMGLAVQGRLERKV